MSGLPVFLLLSGLAVLCFALCFMAFELCFFFLYKIGGGRLSLTAYLKKL